MNDLIAVLFCIGLLYLTFRLPDELKECPLDRRRGRGCRRFSASSGYKCDACDRKITRLGKLVRRWDERMYDLWVVATHKEAR